MKNLIASLELHADLNDLEGLGLTDEEILGFIDFYCENWFARNSIEINN